MTLLTKNSFLDEIRKQYVLTARAKGCSERQVLYGHVFRNAMLIVIAGFPGAFVHAFFAGSLLIETIFSLDGLGLLGFESVLNRDYPVVFATLYIFSLVGLVVNLISDLTYTWVDPRIDFETRRSEVDDRTSDRGARDHGAIADGARRAPGRSRLALSPINRRRWENFKANRRGYWSFWIFLVLFVLPLGAEFIANDKPFFVKLEGKSYFPVFVTYPETGVRRRVRDRRRLPRSLSAEADRRQGRLHDLAADPLFLRYPQSRSADAGAVEADLDADREGMRGGGAEEGPAELPRPRIQLARHRRSGPRRGGAADLRLPHLGAVRAHLTIISSVIGVAAGAVQGYFGGWVDLLFQRFIEIWTSVPSLYLLLIISSVLVPGFFVLLGILLLFSWVSLVGLVRAEFLRGRNFEYIQAARALGVSNRAIMFRHLLPNAMVATMTFLPFILSSSVMTLTALDFLGFGLPPGSASLGELLKQGKANIQAPWLGFSGFFTVAGMLSLLIFIGEAVRDAFDPREDVRVKNLIRMIFCAGITTMNIGRSSRFGPGTPASIRRCLNRVTVNTAFGRSVAMS